MARAWIGTSGFTYKHWRDVFYPEGVPQKRWLEYYAGRFGTVELNNTFYAMPREKTCASWAARTPEDFLFAVKLTRIITHRWRLMHSEELLARFLEAARALGSKLGPVLVQLPPRWQADPARLAAFFDMAPKERRWCVEFRDPSWLRDDVYRVLRDHNAALVIHDLIPDHPRVVTADWVYLRYHGAGAKYAGSYGREELSGAAKMIRGFLEKRLEVFAYFNNDAEGKAVRNAAALEAMITKTTRTTKSTKKEGIKRAEYV